MTKQSSGCNQSLFIDWFSPTCSSPSLSLIQDLLNFDDPLNIDAAEHHLRDKVRLHCFEECGTRSDTFRGDSILIVLSSGISINSDFSCWHADDSPVKSLYSVSDYSPRNLLHSWTSADSLLKKCVWTKHTAAAQTIFSHSFLYLFL